MAETKAEQNNTDTPSNEIPADAKPVLCDFFKGKLAKLKEDFLTDDECSCDVLIKKGSKVYIKGNECDGTCCVEYLDFGFSIDAVRLNIA